MIHKIIGYGLNNINSKDNKFLDKRLCQDGYIFNPDQYSADGLRTFLDANNISYNEKDLDIDKGIILLPKEKIICFLIPHLSHKWHRKDDPIDIEEFEKPAVKYLKDGIAGYRNFIDKRDGRKVDSTLFLYFLDSVKKYKSMDQCEKIVNEFNLTEIACDLGFRSTEEAEDNTVPEIPSVIYYMIMYLKIFEKKHDIMSLRPMALTIKY